MMMMMITQL